MTQCYQELYTLAMRRTGSRISDVTMLNNWYLAKIKCLLDCSRTIRLLKISRTDHQLRLGASTYNDVNTQSRLTSFAQPKLILNRY